MRRPRLASPLAELTANIRRVRIPKYRDGHPRSVSGVLDGAD